MDGFALAVLLIAFGAGAVASVSGFGIGSILTPLLSLAVGLKLAVALVSIPHLLGTLLRFFLLRTRLDFGVLRGFGIASAAGGLAGALLHGNLSSPLLTVVFAGLLLFAGFMGLTGLSDRMRFGKNVAWLAGVASGLLGGLVGNQGGIRSAALLGFDLQRETFVATATAIGLIVDGARIPVYLATTAPEMARNWTLLLPATAGVLAGTAFGDRLLRRIPEKIFRPVVAALILTLGFVMLLRVL